MSDNHNQQGQTVETQFNGKFIIHNGYSIEQYETKLKETEAKLRAELKALIVDETQQLSDKNKLLEIELTKVKAQITNIETSYQQKIQTDLTNNLTDYISHTSKLSSEKTTILSKAVGSIIDYVAYKSDPKGNRFLVKNVKEGITKQHEAIINTALSLYTNIITKELESQETIEGLFLKTEKYFSNSSFQSFLKLLTEPPETSKRKKREKSKFHNNKTWWDRFCELLDGRYEEWRHVLLGTALYRESEHQGSLSYTTLWQIVHLPPHSWDDLTQYKSIAGEVWVNGQFHYNFFPATYSALSTMDYSIDDNRRLICDLCEALSEDNLQHDSGVIVLNEEDENIFKINGRQYLIVKNKNYEDPVFENVENTPLEGKLRLFGTKLTYVGEEILDLATGIPVHAEVDKLFELAAKVLSDEGIEFHLKT